MLIQYKDRVIFKAIVLAVIAAFLFNDMAFALAPELRSSGEDAALIGVTMAIRQFTSDVTRLRESKISDRWVAKRFERLKSQLAELKFAKQDLFRHYLFEQLAFDGNAIILPTSNPAIGTLRFKIDAPLTLGTENPAISSGEKSYPADGGEEAKYFFHQESGSSLLLPGDETRSFKAIDESIRPFFMEGKNGGAAVVAFEMGYAKRKKGEGLQKKEEKLHIRVYRKNGEIDYLASSERNSLKGLNEKTKAPISKLLDARRMSLDLSGSLPVTLDARESLESIKDLLKGMELAVLPDEFTLNGKAITHIGFKRFGKRLYIGSRLIDNITKEDLALLLLETARYAARPIAMNPSDIRHNTRLLAIISAKLPQETGKEEGKMSKLRSFLAVIKNKITRINISKNAQPAIPREPEVALEDIPKAALDKAVKKLEDLKEYKKHYEIEKILREISDAIDATKVNHVPVIGETMAIRLANAILKLPDELLRERYITFNMYLVTTGLINAKEKLPPEFLKKMGLIYMALIALERHIEEDSLFNALFRIVIMHHSALDMKTVEGILGFCIEMMAEGRGPVSWEGLSTAFNKVISAQRYFSRDFIDSLIKAWGGSFKEDSDMEDSFAEIIRSGNPLSEDQVSVIQGKLLGQLRESVITPRMKAITTMGALMRSKRKLHKEGKFLKRVLAQVRRHIRQNEKGDGVNVHLCSLISDILASGRSIPDEGREFLEKHLWKIWLKSGPRDDWDGTEVNITEPYLYGMQGHISTDVPFGSGSLDKKLGPFWKTAFAMTDEAFSTLDIEGLATGSRSLIKVLILKEALRRGSLDKGFMQKVKDELIPSVRVIEKMCDKYPTLGIETKKSLSSKDDYIAASWQASIVNYLSDVRMETALGKSYASDNRAELRIPPTVYPILRRLMREVEELIIDKPSLYHTSVAGDYSDESRFMLSSFFFTATPPGSSFPINPEDDSYVEWAFPGYAERYIGATIDPWTGKMMTIYDDKTRGTQTNFFHTATNVTLEDGQSLAFYKDDIRRVFFLSAAAAAMHKLYGLDDQKLAQMFGSLKKDVLDFYIRNFYISENDLDRLTAQSSGKDMTYTEATSDIYTVLKRISSGFIRSPGDSAEAIAGKKDLHARFQGLVGGHIDRIEKYLFPGELGKAIELSFTGGDIRDVYIKIRQAAFSQDKITSDKALAALKEARDPDFSRIENAVNASRPSAVQAIPAAEKSYPAGGPYVGYAEAIIGGQTENKVDMRLKLDDAKLIDIDDSGLHMNTYEKTAFIGLLFSPSMSKDEILARQEMIRSMRALPEGGIKNLLKVKTQCYEYLGALASICGRYREPDIKKAAPGSSPIPSLFAEIENIDDPLIKEILFGIKKRLGGFSGIDPGELQRLINEKNDVRLQDIKRRAENAAVLISSIGTIISFAEYSKRSMFVGSRFDDSRPVGYKKGWNFTKAKEENIPNDSVNDRTATLLTGSNMSGKTFYLAQNLFMQLLGQAFGYVPAESANLRIYDQIVFIDRASTDSINNLSAFGSEVGKWREPLEKANKNSLFLVDEGFSTTSPEDQARLLRGCSSYLRNKGAHFIFATHSEDFIEAEEKKPGTGVYHFEVRINKNADTEKGEKSVEFTHKIKAGKDDSRAIEVAEALGLQARLIQKAKDYLAAAVNPPVETRMRRSPKIVRYSEKERSALKKQMGSFLPFFPFEDMLIERNSPDDVLSPYAGGNRFKWRYGRKDMSGYSDDYGNKHEELEFDPVFRLFSHDRDFQSTQYRLDNERFNNQAIVSAIHSLILWSGSSDPKEVLERQDMFRRIITDKEFLEGSDIKAYDLAVDVLNYLRALNMEHDIELDHATLERGSPLTRFNLYLIEESYETASEMFVPSHAEFFLEAIEMNLKLFPNLEKESAIRSGIERIRAIMAVTEEWKTFNRNCEKGDSDKAVVQNRYLELCEKTALATGGKIKRVDSFGEYELEGLVKSELNNLYKRIGGTPRKDRETGGDVYMRTAATIKGIGDFKPVSALEEANWAKIQEALPLVKKACDMEQSTGMPFIQPHVKFVTYLEALLRDEDIIGNLIAYIRRFDSVHLQQIANYLEFILRPIVKDLANGRDYLRRLEKYRSDKFGDVRLDFGYQDEKIFTEIAKLINIFYLALLIKENGWRAVEFTDEPDLSVKNPWSMVKLKKDQVKNSAHFGEDERVRLYSGSNMSGKTYHIKQLIWSVLAAQATGFAPNEGMMMPIFDRVMYIDRITHALDRNTSSFGTEVNYWKAFFDIVEKSQGLVFAGADEAASSTSPRYQSALSYAIADEMLVTGNMLAMASHNHDFISRFIAQNRPHSKVYHFRTHEDEKGGIVFDYKLEEGHELSDAVRAAEKMGLGMITALIPPAQSASAEKSYPAGKAGGTEDEAETVEAFTKKWRKNLTDSLRRYRQLPVPELPADFEGQLAMLHKLAKGDDLRLLSKAVKKGKLHPDLEITAQRLLVTTTHDDKLTWFKPVFRIMMGIDKAKDEFRRHMVWPLVTLGDFEGLEKIAIDPSIPLFLRTEAMRGFGDIPTLSVVKVLADDNPLMPYLKGAPGRRLGEMSEFTTVKKLSEDPGVLTILRIEAAKVLSEIKPYKDIAEPIPVLKKLAIDSTAPPAMRREALRALRYMCAFEAIAELIPVMFSIIENSKDFTDLEEEAISGLCYAGAYGSLTAIIKNRNIDIRAREIVIRKLKAGHNLEKLKGSIPSLIDEYLSLSGAKDEKEPSFRDLLKLVGLKIKISIYEAASVRAAKGFISAMGLDKDTVLIGYDDQIDKQAAGREFSGYEIEPLRKENDSAVTVEFRDQRRIVQPNGESYVDMILPYYPFKYGRLDAAKEDITQRIKTQMDVRSRKVIVMTGHLAGEFDKVLASYNTLYLREPVEKRPILIFAPREKLDRPDLAGGELLSGHKFALRTDNSVPFENMQGKDILILDTRLELPQIFAIADLCIVGDDRNILEPAAQNKAVLYMPGDWRQNKEAKDEMTKSGAAAEFSQENLASLLTDSEMRQHMESRSLEVVKRFNNEIIPPLARNAQTSILPGILLKGIRRLKDAASAEKSYPAGEAEVTRSDSHRPLKALDAFLDAARKGELKGLKVSQAAAKLGVHEATVHRYLKTYPEEAVKSGIVRRFRYSWDSKDEAIENILDAIKTNRPDIIKRYEKLKSLTDPECRALKEDIYSITAGHFILWGLNSILCDKDKFFNGSHTKALMTVFAELHLDRLGFQLLWETPKERVASIRYVLSQNTPDLVRRYDELDVNNAAEVRTLQDEFYKLSSYHFLVWGVTAPFHKKVAPEFEGSYIRMLQVVFPRLKLNPLGFRLNWSDRDNAIASVRFVLSRRLPELMEKFEKIDSLSAADVQELKRGILSITTGQFSAWGMHLVLFKNKTPYFNGNISQALMAVFNHPRLALRKEDFRKRSHKVYKWTGGLNQGIANIRDIIGKNRPDIAERYERLDNLSDAEKRSLADDIYSIQIGNFSAWGIGKISRRRYFNGSYKDALIASFPRLNLERMGFELEWDDPEQRIKSIEFVLNREVPDIMSRYRRHDDMTAGQLEALKRDICHITCGHVRLWGLSAILSRDIAPEFEGSYIKAMITVFRGMGLKVEDFQLDYSSEERSNASVRHVVCREIPGLKELYDNIGRLNEGAIEKLRQKIYKITYCHCMAWGLNHAIHKDKVKYYGGSYINMLIKAFGHPKLKLSPSGFVNMAFSSAEISTLKGYLPEDLVAEYLPLMQKISLQFAMKRNEKDPYIYLSGALAGLKTIYEKYPRSSPWPIGLVIKSIRWGIMSQIRDESKTSRRESDGLREIRKATEKLHKDGVTIPSLEEISSVSGLKPEKIKYLQELAGTKHISQLTKDEDSAPADDFLADEKATADEEQKTIHMEVKELLKAGRHVLSAVEYRILKRHYLDRDHPGFKAIGREFKPGISESRVSQLHKSAIEKLKQLSSGEKSYPAGRGETKWLKTIPSEPEVRGLDVLDRLLAYRNYQTDLIKKIAYLERVKFTFVPKTNIEGWGAWITHVTAIRHASSVLRLVDLLKYSDSKVIRKEVRKAFQVFETTKGQIKAIGEWDQAEATKDATHAGTEEDPAPYALAAKYFARELFVKSSNAKRNLAIYKELIRRLELTMVKMKADFEEFCKKPVPLRRSGEKSYPAGEDNAESELHRPGADTAPTVESERIQAIDFRDAVIERAKPAKETTPKTIVALGTNWIPGYNGSDRSQQYKDLNGLIVAGMRQYCEDRNIPFIDRDDSQLLREINEARKRSGYENAKVIVLAGESAIQGDLKTLQDDKNVFMMGVDASNFNEKCEPGKDFYIRIMEMVRIALEVEIEKDRYSVNNPPPSPNIPIEFRKGFWIFIPRAERIRIDSLQAIYAVQRAA